MLESMKRMANAAQAADARLKKLAEAIAALAKKDEAVIEHAREIAETRIAAASELYSICAEFVAGLNRLLGSADVMLDPPESVGLEFRDDSPCLIQINARGRILQIGYGATAELVSTEEFRIPYTMMGSVRAFNQELLEKDLIEEHLIFFTLEKHRRMWRFFDPRTYRSGPFDQEYLVSLMEQLV